MSKPASINPQIIEGLYSEALVLADEVRARFAQPDRADAPYRGDEDLARVALSCEGLRTTTRMMHAIAWLLNQRAYFMGELSEYQLRRHGKLSHNLKGPDMENMVLLDGETCELIAETDRLYARLLRLDNEWRQAVPHPLSALDKLRQRLAVGN